MTVEEAANGGVTGDSSLLLGRAGCPIWLNPERFLEAEFNADACVADLRRYVPLATLQSELSSYLSTLKTKLVEVINEDYADYVGLSGRLANVEGSVVRMRKPLLDLRVRFRAIVALHRRCYREAMRYLAHSNDTFLDPFNLGQDKLHAVQEAVRSELNSLNQGLRKRKEVATQRSLLELILEVSHVAGKVDKLLEEVAAADRNTADAAAGYNGTPVAATPTTGSPAAGPSNSELVAQCRLLERVAAEVSRLTFLANKGKDLAFVRSLEPRIAAHRSALRGRLSTALSTALSPAPGAPASSGPRSTAAALHALHAAADLGEAGPAESVVRTVVVAPLVERVIGEHKTHGHASLFASAMGGGSGGGGLSVLLSDILAGVRSGLGPLLDASLAPGSALRSIDLLSNAVLDEVQGALAAALPGVFSPGVPPAFHANYLATLAWLRQLEALCATRGSVERLRSSTAYTSLMRRWNTSVYFSLLFQEIAGELEDALSSDKLEPASAAAPTTPSDTLFTHPQLAATAVLLRCLRRAVSSEIVLPPLTDRFLRLALQLTQRYATWVTAAAMARREATSSVAAPGSAVAPATPPMTPAQVPPLAPGAGTTVSGSPSGATAAAGSSSGPAAWAPSLPAEELIAVVADTERVHSATLGPLTASFLELLPPAPSQPVAAVDNGGTPAANGTKHVANGVANGAHANGGAGATPVPPSPVVDTVRGALLEAAATVQASGRSLAAVLTDEVVERCVVVIRQLKGITATYRMTSKGPPTRHSHYVSGVLTPLRQLLESGPVRRLPEPLQQELLVLPVAEGVCGRYCTLAEELLLSVRNMESSLKRLKKAKGGAGAEEDSAATISDSDKITLQLHLDVIELGRQLEQLMPTALDLPSFRRLLEVVAPPPGLLSVVSSGATGS